MDELLAAWELGVRAGVDVVAGEGFPPTQHLTERRPGRSNKGREREVNTQIAIYQTLTRTILHPPDLSKSILLVSHCAVSVL